MMDSLIVIKQIGSGEERGESGASLNGHNFSSVGPITLIQCFSESLVRGEDSGG